MIPKVIHYVWIGGSKGNLENICINSWREKLPEYEIIEWNESNIEIDKLIKENSFFKECYDRKLWAFISDYVRIKVLYEYGGIYLDTDMQITKDINPLLENKLFLGYEDEKYVSAGIIGSIKGHPLLKDMIEFYESDIWKTHIYTIPAVITYILDKKYTKINRNLYSGNITIYDTEYFYPFHYEEKFTYECIKENTYGIHWWNQSWGKKRNYFLESKHLTGLSKYIRLSKVFAFNILKRRK